MRYDQFVDRICFENSGGSSELIDDSSGFVVPYGDTKEMASIILEVKKSTKTLLELSKGIYKKSKTFNNKNALEKIFKIVMTD